MISFKNETIKKQKLKAVGFTHQLQQKDTSLTNHTLTTTKSFFNCFYLQESVKDLTCLITFSMLTLGRTDLALTMTKDLNSTLNFKMMRQLLASCIAAQS